MNHLEIKNLVCGYRKFRLDIPSFCLEEGSLTGIIGPNGSGKTTLLKGILGDLPLKNGQITLHGKDLRKMSIREKAQKMAVVTQQLTETDLNVLEFVLLGRLPHRSAFQFFDRREDLRIADHYIQMLGLSPLRNKPLSNLSGGEKQTACIAKALTQQASLLLLDEPTSQLDIAHQVQILDLIKQWNRKMHLTVLMIVHDLNLASEYCDRLLVMNRGNIHKQGSPEEVMDYQILEEVYQTRVVTGKNPTSGKPAVFLVSNKNI